MNNSKLEEITINPSEYTTSQKINLNKSGSAFIEISMLSGEFYNYTKEHFDDFFNLHPIEKSKVVMKNKNNENCHEVDAHRWYESYLNTPKLNQETLETSYMFSGLNDVQKELPEKFKPLFDYINKESEYNQIVVNWYADQDDYLPYHADWQHGMTKDSNIATLTLNKIDDDTQCRTFIIKPKGNNDGTIPDDVIYKKINIILKHGTIIKMYGDSITNFRHGIPKSVNQSTPRIGVTFRQFD